MKVIEKAECACEAEQLKQLHAVTRTVESNNCSSEQIVVPDNKNVHLRVRLLPERGIPHKSERVICQFNCELFV